jgi:2-keto-3-deoxy-6-phosphogluconate aldolase
MKAALEELDRAFDYAPVMAWLDSPNAEWILRAFSACWTGGLRTFSLPMEIPQVASLLETMTARSEVLVGCSGVGCMEEVSLAADAGAVFVITHCVDVGLGRQIQDKGMVWIPEIKTDSDLGLAGELGAHLVHFACPAEKGGPVFIRNIVETHPTLKPLVSGVQGNELVPYIDAGARAVALSGALYTTVLLEEGDNMTIRHQAAIIAKQATQHSVLAKEQMKRG